MSALGYISRSFFSKSAASKVSSGRDAIVATGSGNTQAVNSHNTVIHSSPTYVNFPPRPAADRTGSSSRYDEWRKVRDELDEAFGQIGYAFVKFNVIEPGREDNDWKAGIARGRRVLSNQILIAGPLEKAGMLKAYEEIVTYVLSGDGTEAGFEHQVRVFKEKLIQAARKDTDDYGGSAVYETKGSGW